MQTEPERISQSRVHINPATLRLQGAEIHKSQDYAEDPHKALMKFAANFIDHIDIAADKLLVATYRRPERTASGLYMTDSNLEEDKFQAAAGLVLKLGSHAFVDDSSQSFGGFHAKQFQWVTYRPTLGCAREFAGLHCRILQDVHIDAVVQDPTLVW